MESMQKNAYKGTHARCSVNPKLGKESEHPIANGNGRTVVIVGAGPAGLMSAEVLAKRGFKPIVLEKNAFPGGQLQLANKPPLKEKSIGALRTWLQTQHITVPKLNIM